MAGRMAEGSMITRIISGLAGIAVLVIAFTWRQYLPTPPDTWSNAVPGLQVTAMILGVYLLFYGVTGDWLPRLSKRRNRS